MDELAISLGRLAGMRKTAQLGKAFLAGIDPLGTTTVELGRKTPESEYVPMQMASTLGGLVGGGLLVPGLLTGTAAVVPEFRSMLMRQPAAGQGLGRQFLEGALNPYRTLWHGVHGYRDLRRMAQTGEAPAAAASERLANVLMKGTTIEQARSMASKYMPGATRALSKVAPKGATADAIIDAVERRLRDPKTTAVARQTAAKAMLPQLSRRLAAGGMLIGLPALLAGYTAYKQYRLGQQLRREQQGNVPARWNV